MAKVNLDYVWIARPKGREYGYYRRDGQSIRIHGEVGSEEFLANYQTIAQRWDTPSPGAQRRLMGSMGFLIDRYRRSPKYKQLSKETRADYERVLQILEKGDTDKGLKAAGHLPWASLPRPWIIDTRDLYFETPRKANLIVQVLSILGNLAIDLDLRDTNPAARIELIKTGPGHKPWEEFHIEAYYKHWPLGTAQRAAADLLLFGGQRRGDTIATVRPHYRLTSFNGKQRFGLFVAQEKTEARIWIPAAEPLIESMEAWLPTHDQMTLLVDPATGKPFHKRGFSGFMRDAMTAAGLPKSVTVHGARYTAATRIWEVAIANGYSDDMGWQIAGSITGHETAKMAKKYTEQKRLAALGVDGLNRALKGASEKPADGSEKPNKAERT